jgi:hypothetical protein
MEAGSPQRSASKTAFMKSHILEIRTIQHRALYGTLEEKRVREIATTARVADNES